MGIQNNEVEEYISQTGEKSKDRALSKKIALLIILLVVVLFCLVLVFLTEKCRLKHSKEQLELEFQYDSLTNAKSRRFGTRYLEEVFKGFQSDEEKHRIAVMLFDIDNFKHINDCYGHFEGDWFPKEIVPAVYKAIRSSDELFRWGGDEFVGGFRVTNEENTLHLIVINIDEENQRKCMSRIFCSMVYEVMDWNRTAKYRCMAIYQELSGKRVVVINLDECL